jgi:hypothetical protein
MLKRQHIAVIALSLGLCLPACAQPASQGQSGSMARPAGTGHSGSAMDDSERYQHGDVQDEEEILEQGPVETEQKTLDFLRVNEPEIYQQLDAARTSDPTEYQHMVTMESHHVRALEDLQTDDPEGFRLTIAELRAHDRVGVLARACREKGGNKAELKAAVDQLFEARMQSERHELDLDRQDLASRDKELQLRESKRQSIVDHYVQSVSVPEAERW